MGSGGVNDYEQPFMVARDVENYLGLPEPEADLTVFHVPAHKISTPTGNQEADALTKICTLANDTVAVDTVD